MSVRQHAVAALGALALVLLNVPAFAQDVSGPTLTAEFIKRLPPFTEWTPAALPPAGPLTMCVVGDRAVRDALERTVRGTTVGGRPVLLAFGQPDKPPPQCHILYVSAVSSAQVIRLVAGLGEVPVLTISDLEGFNKLGGMIEVFYEGGRLRFSLQLDAVAKAGLRLSSRLISLARPRR